MMQLTRRKLFASAAAASAATALTPFNVASPAFAAAPPAGKQVPGVYRQKLGDFELTQITDGAARRPVSNGYVVNISKEEAVAETEKLHYQKDQVIVPFNPLLINTGSKLVLIDTGVGPGLYEKSKGAVGQLHTNMAAAGIDRNAVDIVILSHFHGDHINGLRLADGGLSFPNAEIKVPGVEWDFWMNEANAAKVTGYNKGAWGVPKGIFTGLEKKVTKYEAGKEVAPGITAMATPGHTPGHMSFTVQSGSARALVQSDVTNIPQFFMRHPDWQVEYDVDPAMAVQTRRKFYDMASAEKTMVIGFHFSFPSAGYVEKDGTGYRLVPIVWNPSI
jgi:glyoxylase-like metal-dependent hydrolase (beta-lactamase superfamily II)